MMGQNKIKIGMLKFKFFNVNDQGVHFKTRCPPLQIMFRLNIAFSE